MIFEMALVIMSIAFNTSCLLGDNWMWFEIGVRDFVMERAIDTIVYTGKAFS